MTNAPLFLGLDIGTQGVRALAVSEAGEVIASARQPLVVPAENAPQEQDPASWWNAVVEVVQQLGELRSAVTALAISCTSGSVCMVDAQQNPVGPGLLYADSRGLPFKGKGSSWAIAKIAWLLEHRPDLVDRAATFTSPGGFVATKLLGEPAAIDVTQALKFGFDPSSNEWGILPVDSSMLPRVVSTGVAIGTLCSDAAQALGLSQTTTVVSGATDGVAGQFACRPSPNRWAVALGSTIVWKALSEQRLDDEASGIYSHRGPGTWWLPGAASTAGARILSTWATDAELADYDRLVMFSTDVAAAYPSVVQGERFPFEDPTFTPWPSESANGLDRYASEALGATFVERWGCEVLTAEGCLAPASIATTGGAVSSQSWMQLRADVMQLPIEIPSEPSSAFGAAVIAAAPTLGGVLEAGESMVRFRNIIEPDHTQVARWDDAYASFKQRCLQQQEAHHERA